MKKICSLCAVDYSYIFFTGTEADGGLLGLPETENELDNLTEFNTAQNRRISMMGIPKEETFIKKRRKIHITFNEEEDVINPWDVDPSIGRFTNLVQSTVIPKASKQQSQVECFHDHMTSSLTLYYVLSPSHITNYRALVLGKHLPWNISTRK